MHSEVFHKSIKDKLKGLTKMVRLRNKVIKIKDIDMVKCEYLNNKLRIGFTKDN